MRRSFVFCGIGALLGLAAAMPAILRADGAAALPPDYAALVNGVPVLRADLRAMPGARRAALDRMIGEELAVQQGLALGLATSDIDVRSALVTATEAQVGADVYTTRPDPATLRRYYQAHRDHYATDGRIEAQDWLLGPHRAGEAAAIAARIRAGADPAAQGLRDTHRLDPALEFYWSTRIHIGPRLAAVAERLPSGTVSAPVALPDGVHILVMRRNTPPVYPPFAAIQRQVLDDYQREQADRLTAGNDRFLRRRADILIARDLR